MVSTFWLIPAGCGVASLILMLAGLPSLVRGRHAVVEHAQRLRSAPVALFDSARLETALERVKRDVAELPPLVDRASAAVREIGAGMGELRLRQALVALRLAGVAIRALAKLG
jgi:hypothetical protein